MVNIEEVKKLVVDEIEDTDVVLVDIQISATNNISILLDSFEGVTITKCIEISRLVEGSLDREKEDFALEVSSYGIVHPFILPLHYLKNVNKKIEVYCKDGRNLRGILKSVDLSDDKKNIKLIEILNKKKVKLEGKKKKVEVEEITRLEGSEIQKAVLVPMF